MRFNLSMLMDRMRIEGVELIREHGGALSLTHAAMIAENAQPTTDTAFIVPCNHTDQRCSSGASSARSVGCDADSVRGHCGSL